MEKFLNELLSSDLLTEETRTELRSSFKTVLEEVKDEARNEARKELAEQYDADRKKLVNAVDKMIRESLTDHLVEFQADVDLLKKSRAKAARAIREADTRASKKVAAVLNTLHEQNKVVIKREIGELVEDFNLQRKEHVKLMREGRATIESERKALVKKMAVVLENITKNHLKKIMETYKSDIRKARENNFGRKMFEAYAAEFETSFFSRDKVLEATKAKLAESEKKRKLLETTSAKAKKSLMEGKKREESKRKKLEESVARKNKISKLTRTLSGSAKTEMIALLEDAPLERMDRMFKNYLDIVTSKKSSGKSRLSEAASGNRKLGSFQTGSTGAVVSETNSSDEVDDDIKRLQRLNGYRRA